MTVTLCIGMSVVMAVMRRPPERAPLHRAGAEQGEEKLSNPRGFEGAVGKITMVEPGDGEHAHEI
jgi:hypothetical protein